MAQVFACSKIIANTLHEWVFGTDHQHINGFVQHEPCHALKVVSLEPVHIDSHLGRTSITRCHIEVFNQRTLRNLPCQGVLAAAASKE